MSKDEHNKERLAWALMGVGFTAGRSLLPGELVYTAKNGADYGMTPEYREGALHVQHMRSMDGPRKGGAREVVLALKRVCDMTGLPLVGTVGGSKFAPKGTLADRVGLAAFYRSCGLVIIPGDPPRLGYKPKPCK